MRARRCWLGNGDRPSWDRSMRNNNNNNINNNNNNNAHLRARKNLCEEDETIHRSRTQVYSRTTQNLRAAPRDAEWSIWTYGRSMMHLKSDFPVLEIEEFLGEAQLAVGKKNKLLDSNTVRIE